MSEWIVCKRKVADVTQKIEYTDFYYNYNKGTSFQDDKVVINDRDLFFILDGVIFNKDELIQTSGETTWSDSVKSLYLKEGLLFIKKIRGSYNGIVIEKKSQNLNAFVDHLGSKPVFYYLSEECLVSSDFNTLIGILKQERKRFSADIEALKRILYFGYMVDNKTCIQEIKRVFPGNYLTISKGKIEENTYFRFKNNEIINEDNESLIEMIDEKFVKALKLQFDKDKEYGYEHLVDISGGLDARAVNFVAKACGYDNITNICYSQMNAYEKTISERLVRRLDNEYLFKGLDNAKFIFSVDDIVKENYGLCYYAGITGGRDFLRALNREKFGIEHTGLLGDIYEGSFSVRAVYEKPHIENRYRISRLLDIPIDQSFLNQYSENEIFLFYTRGLLAGTSTHLIRNKYFETYTPFGDIDFLNLMFQIPLKKRIDEQIYLKWLSQKYPDAMKEKYAKTMCKPLSGKLQVKLRSMWNVFLLNFYLPLKKKLNYNSEWNYKATMNPMDYWYEKKSEVKIFIDDYYNENISLVKNDEIKGYLKIMFEKGNMLDKEVMLTVLSIYKQYISE